MDGQNGVSSLFQGMAITNHYLVALGVEEELQS